MAINIPTFDGQSIVYEYQNPVTKSALEGSKTSSFGYKWINYIWTSQRGKKFL